MSVTHYLSDMVAVGAIATLLPRDRNRIPLGPDYEAEQAVSPVPGLSKAWGALVKAKSRPRCCGFVRCFPRVSGRDTEGSAHAARPRAANSWTLFIPRR